MLSTKKSAKFQRGGEAMTEMHDLFEQNEHETQEHEDGSFRPGRARMRRRSLCRARARRRSVDVDNDDDARFGVRIVGEESNGLSHDF